MLEDNMPAFPEPEFGESDMKFLLFSDLHFAPDVFMGATWEALHQMQKHAEKAGCEFIIRAGDFCHGITDNPVCDQAGRPVRPVVQSAVLTLG